MWQKYVNATSVDESLQLLAKYGNRARIVAGATDLILEIERGVRKGIEVLIDITRIPNLDRITLDENNIIHLGPLVTHNHCVSSKIIVEQAILLAQAAWLVGAPQIRNRGTVAGNLITASPANDTITPLMALDAAVKLVSVKGERTVPLNSFYTGVRKTMMEPDEMLADIFFPAMQTGEQGIFLKLGLRQAQAISLVNVAIRLSLDGGKISEAAITLGAVAPTIVHARKAEIYLIGKELTEDTIEETAQLTMEAATPIDDVRGSAAYRRAMVSVLTSRGLRSFLSEESYAQFPESPILLWGQKYRGEAPLLGASSEHLPGSEISTNVNGIEYRGMVGNDQTLLDFLRDQLGLIGTKEGCAEGECGACTVWLDGMAVMACLVPAVRAHNAEIITVEGLGDAEHLHPVQQAFIHEGAVQCGYCTPGFLMSAAKLLEEIPNPSRDQIQQAITGNLCRCTGYYKIVEAIEQASFANQKSAAGFRT